MTFESASVTLTLLNFAAGGKQWLWALRYLVPAALMRRDRTHRLPPYAVAGIEAAPLRASVRGVSLIHRSDFEMGCGQYDPSSTCAPGWVPRGCF